MCLLAYCLPWKPSESSTEMSDIAGQCTESNTLDQPDGVRYFECRKWRISGVFHGFIVPLRRVSAGMSVHLSRRLSLLSRTGFHRWLWYRYPYTICQTMRITRFTTVMVQCRCLTCKLTPVPQLSSTARFFFPLHYFSIRAFVFPPQLPSLSPPPIFPHSSPPIKLATSTHATSPSSQTPPQSSITPPLDSRSTPRPDSSSPQWTLYSYRPPKSSSRV